MIILIKERVLQLVASGKVVVEPQESFKEVKVMNAKELYEDELSLPLNKISEIK